MTTNDLQADTVCIERTVIDTVVTFAPDSALLKALFECDSNGNVLVQQLETAQGARVSVAPQFKYIMIKDNGGRVRTTAYLAVLAYADSLQTQVYMLKESLNAAKMAVKQAENKQTKQPNRTSFFLFGFLAGAVLLCLIVISIIVKNI